MDQQLSRHLLEHKSTTDEKIVRALEWSKQAGIMNWGYFFICLAG